MLNLKGKIYSRKWSIYFCA